MDSRVGGKPLISDASFEAHMNEFEIRLPRMSSVTPGLGSFRAPSAVDQRQGSFSYLHNNIDSD